MVIPHQPKCNVLLCFLDKITIYPNVGEVLLLFQIKEWSFVTLSVSIRQKGDRFVNGNCWCKQSLYTFLILTRVPEYKTFND